MTTAKHTAGPWHAPHFADDTCTCNCRSVVSECYAGAICTVEFDNGLRIEDGGNDAPPLEQAKANARLIAAAPDLLEALKGAIGALEFSRDYHADLSNAEQAFAQDKLDAALAALAKAEGRP